MRRAHGISKEGAPSGKRWSQVWERAATSPTSIQVSNQSEEEGGRATSQECGLPPQGCATSPKGGALPNRHMLQIKYHVINQISIKLSLSPLTFSLTLCLYCVFNLVPTYLFIFALADFY
jgi:hypothetical protein